MEIFTLIIAALALLASAFSIYESRKNNRISSTPFLMGQEFTHLTSYEYWIANKGKGVAVFDSVEYFYKNEQCKYDDLKESVEGALKKHGVSHQLTSTRLGDKIVMDAGERILIARILFPETEAVKFQEALDVDMNIRIKYHSSHGEMKVFNTND